jgi:large subunit ribosomal protein L31e
MADKKIEPKMEYEREYIVPLRQGWLKVPEYKRANKAVKTLKEFLARHMKVYDRDLRRIKVDIDVNNEIRFRGMKKPPAKVKVKAKRFDDGTVSASLVDLPKHIEFRNKRSEKKDTKKTPEIKPAEDIKKDVEKAVEDKKKDSKKEIKKSENKPKVDAGKASKDALSPKKK